MQKDGNLAMYHKAGGQVLWATQTFGNPGAYLQMQSDGNLVVYKKTGGQGKGGNLWASDTFRSPGSYLQLQDDGNMVVYKKDGGQGKGGSLWSSDTFGRPVTFTSGLELRPGQWIENKNTTLLMQRDGNLVLQHRESGVTVWASGTSGWATTPVCRMTATSSSTRPAAARVRVVTSGPPRPPRTPERSSTSRTTAISSSTRRTAARARAGRCGTRPPGAVRPRSPVVRNCRRDSGPRPRRGC